MIQAHAASSACPVENGLMGWKKMGIGVLVAFTLKGLVTTALMLMVMLEFVHG